MEGAAEPAFTPTAVVSQPGGEPQIYILIRITWGCLWKAEVLATSQYMLAVGFMLMMVCLGSSVSKRVIFKIRASQTVVCIHSAQGP